MILESDVENYLKHQVNKLGGLTFKFTSPSVRGVPDRIVIFQGKVVFVEVKRPGKKPRTDQRKMIEKIQSQKVTCLIIDRKKQVDQLIIELLEGGEDFHASKTT